MPAHIKSLGALGAKVVTVYKDNLAKHGLPTVLGTIILLDEATGFPIALMDGGYLTAMRTGAVSLGYPIPAASDPALPTAFSMFMAPDRPADPPRLPPPRRRADCNHPGGAPDGYLHPHAGHAHCHRNAGAPLPRWVRP